MHLNTLALPSHRKLALNLESLNNFDDDLEVTQRVQALLDPLCLIGVTIDEKPKPTLSIGPARPRLTERGWKTFLIKVDNRVSARGRILYDSPNAKPLPHSPAGEVESRWMQLSAFEGRPLNPEISGLALEYRVVQIYCRDAGVKNGLLEVSFSPTGKGGETIRQWRFDRDADGWFAMNQTNIKVSDGSLRVTSTGNDPYMGSKVKTRPGPFGTQVLGKSRRQWNRAALLVDEKKAKS